MELEGSLNQPSIIKTLQSQEVLNFRTGELQGFQVSSASPLPPAHSESPDDTV